MDSNQEKDQGLPSCIGVYLTRIIKKMHYRKRVCQEVMQELSAHLQDEIRDSDASQDEDKTAQGLIAEFGDAKTLAILMRRAKKRCRPLWRKAIIRSLQTGAVLMVLFICYVFSIFLGKPSIQTDYLTLLNQASRPELMDADNAWSHYERAAQVYQNPSERISKFIRTGPGIFMDLPSFNDLPEKQQAYIAAHARASQAHWEQFDEVLQGLLRKYYAYGLVPYRIDPYSLQDAEQFARANEHWVLDSAIRNMVARSRLVSDRSYESMLRQCAARLNDMVGPAAISLPLATNDSRLELIAGIVEPLVPLPFDPNDKLDKTFRHWLGQNEVPDNYYEGLYAGMLNYWMEQGPQTADSSFAAVNPFAREALVRWVKDNEPAWQEFMAGSQRPYCHREYTSDSQNGIWLMTVLLPHLSELRNLGRLGKWRAQLSLKRGDAVAAIESSFAVVRAGRHIQKAPTLVEQLVGVSLSRAGHTQLLRIVAAADLSGEQLQQLSQELTALYPNGYPMINPEFEKLAFHDTVQHMFTDGGLGGGHIVPKQFSSILFPGDSQMTEMGIRLGVGLLHARRNDTMVQGDRMFDRITEIRQLTPFQKRQSKTSAEDFLEGLPPYKYALIHMMAPAADRCFEIGYRIRTEHQGLLTVLALHRWHRENDKYPVRLNELVTAGLLAEVPVDPFGAASLSYRKVGDSFTLYSFGANLKDDNGTPPVGGDGRINMWLGNGDAVIWPVMN